MTKKFICVQGSPEIPKGSEVKENGTMYELWIYGKRYATPRGMPVDMYPWQIEGNDCWEEVTEPTGRWVPEQSSIYYAVSSDGDVISHLWVHDEYDKGAYRVHNVYRTQEEAQDEIKRRESIANAWLPELGVNAYVWDINSKKTVFGNPAPPSAYIGACHKTKEACEDWGEEYGHLFDKSRKYDERERQAPPRGYGL